MLDVGGPARPQHVRLSRQCVEEPRIATAVLLPPLGVADRESEPCFPDPDLVSRTRSPLVTFSTLTPRDRYKPGRA